MKKFPYKIKYIWTIYLFARITFPARKLIASIVSSLLSIRQRKPIVVLGLSRSGTTMLGKFLSMDENSEYIHEPVKQLFKYQYDLKKRKQLFWDFVSDSKNKKLKMHYFFSILLFSLLSRQSTKAICLKEVSLTNVLGDIDKYLTHAQVLYISRHPCGRTESVLRQRVNENKEEQVSINLVGSIANSWGRDIKMAQQVCSNNTNWHWVLFEELASDPVNQFKILNHKFQLPWTDEIRNWIHELTSTKDGGFYQAQRIASRQADKWKESLTREEIEAIRQATIKYKTNIYTGF